MTHHKYTTPTIPENVEERFWSNVDRSGECWLYVPGPSRTYGLFCPGHQRKVGAHRFSYELAYGPIPEGMKVCHNCPGGDNPRCVNPAHLWLGTTADNNRDMHQKGRHRSGDTHPSRLRPETRPRGETHSLARLDADKVRAIRRLHADGAKGTDLAARYGVSPSTIWLVVHRKKWVHVLD